MKILIMAGGGGTRLWPLSRNKKPKQFHRLVGDKSLLQITYDRLSYMPGVKKSDIFISSNAAFEQEILSQVRGGKDMMILEPAKRDNAAAIGLALVSILARTKNPQEVVGIFPSDHIILNKQLFSDVVKTAFSVAAKERGVIVTLGIRPTYPETGFGYIQMSSEKIQRDKQRRFDVYRIESFKEKPDIKTAVSFLQSFRYLWNAGMFFFRLDTMLTLYKKHLPELYKKMMEIQCCLNTPDEKKMIERIYPTMPATSIDYGIIEKTKNVLVIPVDHLGWSDVGNFKSLWEILDKDKDDNVLDGKNILERNCQKSLIYSSNKPVICLGLKDMVIVDTPDVLFVADKKESQKLKELLEELKHKGYSGLL